MLTNKQILNEADKIYESMFLRGAFIEGATWANNENAAEIAELKAENERLKERLFKYENRDSE